MTIYNVVIESVSPLLMRRWGESSETDPDSGTRPIRIQDQDPRTQAEGNAYRNPEDDSLYLPGAAIARMIREAGGAHKETGSRRSLKYIVPAACIVLEDAIPLLDVTGKRITDFEIDSRPVVIPSTKGRIMRHRPKINDWVMRFSVDIDAELLAINVVYTLISQGGRRLGIGDYRPERGGPFGRFNVTHWEPLEAPVPKATRRYGAPTPTPQPSIPAARGKRGRPAKNKP